MARFIINRVLWRENSTPLPDAFNEKTHTVPPAEVVLTRVHLDRYRL